MLGGKHCDLRTYLVEVNQTILKQYFHYYNIRKLEWAGDPFDKLINPQMSYIIEVSYHCRSSKKGVEKLQQLSQKIKVFACPFGRTAFIILGNQQVYNSNGPYASGRSGYPQKLTKFNFIIHAARKLP